MTDGPTTGDREQQRKDNVASRRQSGVEPLPQDREEQEADREEQTRRAERIQQTGEGIRGTSTDGRGTRQDEDEVRRAAEGEDEGGAGGQGA
ncbi:MAG: hypothetical protein KY466_03440 [Gemmatimonadetes bacterium]|nr:hypothetical protein [Gemmatimonadota bacterium]